MTNPSVPPAGQGQPIPPQGYNYQQPQEEETKKRTGLWVLIGAVVLILALIAGILLSSDKEENTASSSSSDTQVEEPVLIPRENGFVDDSGAQQDLESLGEVALGENEAVQSLSLIAGDGEAPVDPVQIDSNGQLLPPTDIQRLAWYSASSVPGDKNARGSSLITGHVNESSQGNGFALRFTQMKLGDHFTVVVNGEPREFVVTEAPFHVVKESGFPDIVNDTEGPNRLVLITCGGEFVGGAFGYADNILVVADPV